MIFANIDRYFVTVFGLGSFVILTAATLLALLFAHVLRIRILSTTPL